MSYSNEIKKSMQMLSKNSKTIFLGQSVEVPGNLLFKSLEYVHKKKKIELPVFEDTQLGMSIGMSLAGKKVVSIFPRWNFLLCATNQLVSHLDKLPIISEGAVTPSILIRTAVGSQRPLFPGYQHIGNMSSAFREMLSNVEIIELFEPEDIFPAYKKAFERDDGKSTIMVEFQDFYNEK